MDKSKFNIDDRPEIIVMIGLPGCGKSTWITQLLEDTDWEFTVVSSDNEIEKLAEAEGMNYNEGFDRFIGKATHIMKQNFRNAVNKGENIIWDQTNMSKKKRRGILNQVPDGYRKIAVVFELTEDELRRRLAQRVNETGKTIPWGVIKNMASAYSPPTKQEGFDVVFFV
jgi:predicted kinase